MMNALKLIKPYIFERRFFIVAGIACLIIVDFMQLLIPRVIKWAIDDLTLWQVDASGLWRYAVYIIGIAVVMGIFRYCWRLCLIGTSRRVEEGLREALFNQIQTLSAPFFAQLKTGDLMAHATNDIQHVRMAIGMGMVALTDAVVLGTASIGFMAYINLKLTVLAVIPMPLIVFGTRFFSKKMHRMYGRVQAAFAELTEVVRERLAGIRIVKTYGREQDALERLRSQSNTYIDLNIRLVRITGAFFPMMALFSNLSLAVVLWVGGRQTIQQTITTGDFVAFISYIGLLTWPMMAMGWVINLIQRGRASLERIDKIMQRRPTIVEADDARPLTKAAGQIQFSEVTFSYPAANGDEPTPDVLTKIDLTLAAGQVLGIVGPPGSGKTTLLNLLPRVFDTGKGRIRLDRHPIESLRLKDLRKQIAFMPQEPFLFAGSIKDNITFGSARTDAAMLWHALQSAGLADTVRGFPHGVDTVVGEKGVILSGGQKQRIALARALLEPRPILVLDDPISQVDTETGAAIIHGIRQLAGRRTILIASHRLSAVSFADQIITLQNGRIVEQGNHDELMQNGQYYAMTHRLQEIEEQTVKN